MLLCLAQAYGSTIAKTGCLHETGRQTEARADANTGAKEMKML